MSLPVYISDLIGGVVTATSAAKITPAKTLLQTIQDNETAALGSASLIQQIRYSKSSFDELIETLAQADQSDTERYKKYPLVHLVRDFSEERGQMMGVYATVSLTIFIIHQSMCAYKVEDRETLVFKPVLYPIYYEFLNQLKKSSWVMNGGVDTFRHTKIDHVFWGDRQLEGSKNILNDYVDAIEIRNLQLQILSQNC